MKNGHDVEETNDFLSKKKKEDMYEFVKVKNLDKMIFKPHSPKQLIFAYTAQPQVVPNLQWRHL